MFERLELRFKETEGNWMLSSLHTDISQWTKFVNGIITIAYDSIENKTYCYYSDFSIDSGENTFDFIIEGKALVEELESTDFRNWSPVLWHDRGTDIEWIIEYNDKNKPCKSINHDMDVPKEFHDFIMIIDKYFKNAHLSKLKELEYNGNFSETIDYILKRSKEWQADENTLDLLKKLVDFIPTFLDQSEFGKWSPKQNSAEYYSSENHFVFSEELLNFKNVILEIETDIKNKEHGIDMMDISLLPDILELKKESKRYLINSRMAILLLIKYIYEYGYNDYCTSYAYEEAFKNGTIIMLLEFIKEYNHF